MAMEALRRSPNSCSGILSKSQRAAATSSVRMRLLLPSIASLLLLLSLPGIHAWTCDSSCGSIAINYPFGSAAGCGSSAFQPYVNCSNGNLMFYTPTGAYRVQSIDYSSNTIIVVDPHMSTCSSMQLSGGFGLPIGAPFSFASYSQVVLIGCSSTSSLYSKQSCDTSSQGQQICQSLYSNCAGLSQIGIVATSSSIYSGSASSCCVVSSSLLSTAPYDVDLPLLQCSAYIGVYHIGSIQSPQSSWLYGIALQYNPSASSPSPPSAGSAGGGGRQNPTCSVCQEAEDSRGAPAAASSSTGMSMLVAAAVISIFTL